MALYTKYRSKKFDEVLSQGHVVTSLQSYLQSEDVPHGYIFFGTRGSGKTSLSRIFARTLNCDDKEFVKKNLEPCNKCHSCKLALENSHPDIIEMDAASNRGIEDVRALKEHAAYLPSVASYKVFIIDEAHMMTKEAFNALLKLLEEPPKHVFFILCTTEIYKLPNTIISRSQVFELKNPTNPDLIKKIEYILSKELGGVSITQQACVAIANLGKGSFRDTETILEKIIGAVNNEGKKKITSKFVLQVLGMNAISVIRQIFSSIEIKDLKKFDSLFTEYVDNDSVFTINDQLIEYSFACLRESLDMVKKRKDVSAMLQLFLDISTQLKTSLNPKYLFYVVIIEFINTTKNNTKDNRDNKDPEIGKVSRVKKVQLENKTVEGTGAKNLLPKENTTKNQNEFKKNDGSKKQSNTESKTEDTEQNEDKDDDFASFDKILDMINSKNL